MYGDSILKEWYDKINDALSVETLEEIRISVFGKKGVLAAEFAKMKDLSGQEKGKLAKELNTHKASLMNEFTAKKISGIRFNMQVAGYLFIFSPFGCYRAFSYYCTLWSCLFSERARWCIVCRECQHVLVSIQSAWLFQQAVNQRRGDRPSVL